MNRRQFMKAGFGGAFALAAGAAGRRLWASTDGAGHKAKADRPNIVFILADDLTYKVLSRYGGTNVNTPHIDSLAAEGMTFRRAYSTMAMCTPFRAELYTGLYPTHNGVRWNHAKTRPGTKSVSTYLEALGYRVALSGKSDFTGPMNTIKGFPAGEGVREFVTSDPSQPFCLFLCSHSPHAPWTQGDASHFDAAKLELCPALHDNPIQREAYTRYLAEVEDLDREVGEILAMLKETGHDKDTLVMFSSEQGWPFGFAKWTNWNLGVHTALLARWPGHIKPGSKTDAMVQLADVPPTFIEIAGSDAASFKLDGTSFLKVLTGQAETHRKYVYGMHNNVPEGEPYPIRSIRNDKYHYIMNLDSKAAYNEKHIMVKKSRLAWWPGLVKAAAAGDESAKAMMDRFRHRPAEELYRSDEDPYEMKNIADDPKVAKVKAQLKAELKRWMAEQHDAGAAVDTKQAYDANNKAYAEAKKSRGKGKKAR